jgi:hypothetical protein
MAFIGAHIQHQLQCSQMEMRKHGEEGLHWHLLWCRFDFVLLGSGDVQGLGGLAHICI